MNRERGYTLIEMLVAIALMAVLVGAGGYSWQRWQQQLRLSQVAVQVRDYLVMLRNDANWHRRDRLPQLIKMPNGWCLNAAVKTQPGCPDSHPLVLIPAWPEVTLSAMTDALGFYGLRNTAWPGHIRLQNSSGTQTIIVSVWGRIRLCQGGENRGCQ